MFFLELQYHKIGIRFCFILLHLGLWVFLLKVALVYECAFWRLWRKICKILPTSNFQSPSQGGVHLEGKIFYFIFCMCFLHSRLSRVDSRKDFDNLSFSFRLVIEALPLVVILDALKFCIESLLSNHLALCWCFALKLSWSFVVLLMLWDFHGF
jgi:hypothetical protein